MMSYSSLCNNPWRNNVLGSIRSGRSCSYDRILNEHCVGDTQIRPRDNSPRFTSSEKIWTLAPGCIPRSKEAGRRSFPEQRLVIEPIPRFHAEESRGNFNTW